MTNKPNIVIVYTGGTIGMVKDYKTKALKVFDFSQIVDKIPELKQLDCHIITVPPAIIQKIESFGKSFDQLTKETVKAFLVDSKKSNFKI